MKPITFDEATRTLGAPVGWDEGRHGPCGGLPVWHGGDSYVSCWRPSWRERFAILFGTPVWLTLIAIGHPPVSLHAKRTVFVPAERQEPAGQDLPCPIIWDRLAARLRWRR